MRVFTRARGLSVAFATLMLAGCESIPMPFMGGEESDVPATPRAAEVEKETKKPELSRNEKVARGLSEELDWFPDLEQPLAQLESQFATANSPEARNETLSSVAYLYDTQLFVLFQDMLDFLPRDARVKELTEQNAWLDRRRSAMTRAFLQFDDENEARIAAGQAFIEATQARIEEIEKKRDLIIIK
ncbi:hypothetical protein [Marinobacterium lutimaris]|uniref:Lysozyme inhibitor LprI N-terminal domain-containing protein n=1 Tax=Marinobacterium lutimaris TaxID=568106 RepID=A0A1H5YJU7_9GAMM|nr:hypothetical protein [Marinobacterium lutimaris]SEG24338.1 hypothetical protein SAMN05444390_1011795 [Marinobacterium lutimaris]